MSSCKSVIVFGAVFLLSQMAGSSLYANPLEPDVVISQTGPGTGSWTTGSQESNAVFVVFTFHVLENGMRGKYAEDVEPGAGVEPATY